MSKKVYLKRIERLEAFVRSQKIEDAKKRHLESLAKMSDEEVASMANAILQFDREGGSEKVEELFRSGLAAIEQLEERGRLGWRAYCEAGGQVAVVDFSDAHEDEGSASRTPDLKGDYRALFEGVKPRIRRAKASNLRRARPAGEPEKKSLSENDTPSKPSGQ